MQTQEKPKKSLYLRSFIIAMTLTAFAKSPVAQNSVGSIPVEHVAVTRAYKGGHLHIAAVIPAAGFIRAVTAYFVFSAESSQKNLKPRQFRSLPLTHANGRFSANLPIAPGESRKYIYYFLRVESSLGERFLPERTQEAVSAYKVLVLTDTLKPNVRLISPLPDSEIMPGSTAIEYSIEDSGAGLNPASLRFMLNGVDYSKSVVLEGNTVKFVLPATLPDGEYVHSISVEDQSGNKAIEKKYNFRLISVAQETGVETTPKPWTGSGSISYGYNGNISNIRKKEDFAWKTLRETEMQNMSVQYTATDGDSVVTLGPATISSQPAAPGVRPNRFLFGFQKKNFDLKWGDISSQISSLTLNTSMLGAHVGYKTDKEARSGRIETRAAYGQTKQPYEPQPGGLSGAYARNSFGTYLGYNLNKDTLVYGAYQNTRDLESSLRDKRGAPIFENQTAEGGLQWDIPDWKLKLTTRYALSLTESREPEKGETNLRQQGYSTASSVAWLFKPLELNLGINFDQTSQNFSVLSGGGAAPDRRSLTLTLARSFLKGVISWNSNNSTYHNNLKKERPETQYNYNTANNLGINIPHFPSINYSNNIIITQSTGIGNVRNQTLTNNNTLGLSYSYELLFKQTLNTNGSLAIIRDQSSPTKGNDSDSLGLNSGWQAQMFRWLSVNLNAGLNENLNRQNQEATINQTLSAALNLTFFSGKLTENINMNQSQSFTRKQGVTSLTNTSYTYGLSTQVNPSEVTKFSLNLNYSVAAGTNATITPYPGNLSVSFQFNMLIKDFEAPKAEGI